MAAAIKRLKTDKPAFDRLVASADNLINIGMTEIYSQPKEALVQAHRKATHGTASVLWQYKWPNNDQVYGPYSADDMHQWESQGYFQAIRPTARMVDRSGSPISHWLDSSTNQIDWLTGDVIKPTSNGN